MCLRVHPAIRLIVHPRIRPRALPVIRIRALPGVRSRVLPHIVDGNALFTLALMTTIRTAYRAQTPLCEVSRSRVVRETEDSGGRLFRHPAKVLRPLIVLRGRCIGPAHFPRLAYTALLPQRLRKAELRQVRPGCARPLPGAGLRHAHIRISRIFDGAIRPPGR